MSKENELKLSAPWIIFYKEIKALFDRDPEIRAVFDSVTMTIKLYCNSTSAKIEALKKVLPKERTYGNETVFIEVIPANRSLGEEIDILAEAFRGNEALSYVTSRQTIFGDKQYALFDREVVQYYIDDTTDLNGLKSTLYEDIARDVFGETLPNVYFCTDR